MSDRQTDAYASILATGLPPEGRSVWVPGDPPSPTWFCVCEHTRTDHTEREYELSLVIYGHCIIDFHEVCTVPGCSCRDFTVSEEGRQPAPGRTVDAAATVAEVQQQRETYRCLCPTRAPHTYACLVLRLVDAERQRDALAAALRVMLQRHCRVDLYCAVPEHGVARAALAALEEKV